MPDDLLPDEGYDHALALLRRVTTPDGLLASPHTVTNYRRVWARDGVVCGLAGLLAEETTVTDGLRTTLETLAAHQGPQGQIPSNLRIGDKAVLDVSYGTLCGRVDTIPWFVVGVCQYAHATGDRAFAERMAPAIERGLDLLTAWEFNGRGLVYVPQGGDWADEFILHGYVLYDQLLRLWALRCAASVLGDDRRADDAERLTPLLRRTFWPSGHDEQDDHYHPQALRQHLETTGPQPFPPAALSPSGYVPLFDGWSNALAILLDLPDEQQRQALFEHVATLSPCKLHGMVPAFWPPVDEGDLGWHDLTQNHRGTFNNRPGHYHNGGLWPIVNGWWGAALAIDGREREAHVLLTRLHAANRTSRSDEPWEFAEYLDADAAAPHGTPHLAWSAAGAVLLDAYLNDRTLLV